MTGVAAHSAPSDGPPRRRRWLRIVLAVVVAGMVVSLPWGGPALMRRMDFFRVRKVEIRGAVYLTPSELLGRVSSVNSIFVGSSNEVGAFESGVMAKLIGTVPSVVLGGFASLAVVATIGMIVPRLRRLGRIDELTPA